MLSFAYLASLLVSLAGLALLDRRHRLALWGGRAVHTVVSVVVGVVFFLVWDVVGIAQGVFFRGAGPYQTGVLIGPELPLEEVFFLTLLCYVTLLCYLAFARVLERRPG